MDKYTCPCCGEKLPQGYVDGVARINELQALCEEQENDLAQLLECDKHTPLEKKSFISWTTPKIVSLYDSMIKECVKIIKLNGMEQNQKEQMKEVARRFVRERGDWL